MMSEGEALSPVRRWLDKGLKTVCVALFAALVLLVAWQVFTRLVLDQPSAWSEELARYVFVWMSLIWIAIAVGEKADVIMDFVVERLPLRFQRIADVIAHLCTLAFVSYVMIYGGAQLVSMAWQQTNPLLPVTQGQLYLVLPLSGALLAFYLVTHVIGSFSADYEGHTGNPEEDLEAAAL